MTDPKMHRGDRRVLLALLSDAENLSGRPLARAAQVSAGRVYAVLDRLENADYVIGTWADGPYPRRRFYRLTAEGRAWALKTLGLAPRRQFFTTEEQLTAERRRAEEAEAGQRRLSSERDELAHGYAALDRQLGAERRRALAAEAAERRARAVLVAESRLAGPNAVPMVPVASVRAAFDAEKEAP